MERQQFTSTGGARRSEIIGAALQLAVTHGFETINLRAVASNVGLSTMALYRHFANKDELLRAMADQVLGAIELPSKSLRWDEWYVAVTLEYWEIMGTYPGLAAYVLANGPVLQTPGALRVTEQMLTVLLDAGFTAAQAALLWRTAHAYLNGMVQLMHGHSCNDPADGRRHHDEKRASGVGAVLAEFENAPDENTLAAGLRRLLAGFGNAGG